MPARMMVRRETSNVPDSPGRWKAGEIVSVHDAAAPLGTGQMPETSGFVHLVISDREPSEVIEYLEAYNKKLEYNSDQYNPVNDNRRFTTTNVRVSASGNNGFTAQGIADSIAAWNTNHPSNTVVLNDTDNLTYFQCDGIMPQSLFIEWQENSQEVALADYYARRRWYITAAGISAIVGAGGELIRTAAEVGSSGFLRDGLLD